MRFASTIAAALCAAVAYAQTHTDCDPTKKTCPDDPALGMSMNQTFHANSKLDLDLWKITAKSPTFSDEGMVFELNKKGESVNIQSQFYIFWGTYEVIMKVSPGAGLISTSVLLSDDLDEIDWEMIGSDTKRVETNYYGRGNVSQANAKYYPTTIPAQDEFHNYTVHWTQEKTEWIYDGAVVRTMAFDEAVDPKNPQFGNMYPQTPCHVNLGLWSAGDSESEGTRDWAGGKTDWTKGPYTMTIKSLRVVDGTTNATSYSYGDQTGSYKSIKIKR
jgi:beta-glucanase (GH16 family)